MRTTHNKYGYNHQAKLYYKDGHLDFGLYIKALVELLNNPDNRYHLTISPKDGYSDAHYYEAMNHLVVLLNQQVYGRQYKNRDKFLEGFCIRERKPGHDYPHFHFIIFDPGGVIATLERGFLDCATKAIAKVYGRRRKLKEYEDCAKIRRLIGEDSWSLQDYFRPEEKKGLEEYLTKSIRDTSMSVKEKLRLFGLLDKECIQFG